MATEPGPGPSSGAVRGLVPVSRSRPYACAHEVTGSGRGAAVAWLSQLPLLDEQHAIRATSCTVIGRRLEDPGLPPLGQPAGVEQGILFDTPVARELAEQALLFHHAPLLASEHAARIADAIEKLATSIDELAAYGKTIEAPDPD